MLEYDIKVFTFYLNSYTDQKLPTVMKSGQSCNHLSVCEYLYVQQQNRLHSKMKFNKIHSAVVTELSFCTNIIDDACDQ